MSITETEGATGLSGEPVTEPVAPPVAQPVTGTNGHAKPKRKAAAKAKAAKSKGKPVKAKAKTTKRKVVQTKRTPAIRDQFGLRQGTDKSKAAAMYARGATLSEVADKIGRVMFNLITELEDKGHKFKRELVINKKTGREVTKYHLQTR